jgi:pimeloyl-ACP methyl ester carboxylesterase
MLPLEMGATSTTGSVRLADGRRLALVATGPESGFPVLYFHGAIGSPLRVSDDLADAIERLGVRWIAVQRPGFAGSDPAPGRTMPGFASDIEELAGALGVERLAVIGVSAGGPYALACAHALPQLVGAAAVCSSLSPLCPPYAVPGLAGRIRAALRVLAFAPRPCTWLFDALLHFAHAHPGLVVRAMKVGASGGDRALLADAEAGSTAAGAFLAATEHGVGGGVEDYLISCRPWGYALEEIEVEVHLWHGAQDALVPVEHAWQLAASLPACRAAFDADEGHFFFRRRAPEILERVVTAGRAAGTSPRGSRGTAGGRADRPSPAR